MSLSIIKAGLQDTIQDMGRYGHQQQGINPGGAMDTFAAATANMLVGNKVNEPVIEIHFPASHFLFNEPALIAICGGDPEVFINGEEIPICKPVLVSKNSQLQFKKIKQGVRTYLAIQKGFILTPWLGSYSTNLKAGAGGYKGRILQKNDQLQYAPFTAASILKNKQFSILPWQAGVFWGDPSLNDFYVLPGNEWIQLSPQSREQFLETPFTLTGKADRMGYLLKEKLAEEERKEELVSTGVGFGTIQLLPNGSLMILMADHQTTGGYPRVAHVITAHHSKLAQVKVGENIRFRLVDHTIAENHFIQQQPQLLQFQKATKK